MANQKFEILLKTTLDKSTNDLKTQINELSKKLNDSPIKLNVEFTNIIKSIDTTIKEINKRFETLHIDLGKQINVNGLNTVTKDIESSMQKLGNSSKNVTNQIKEITNLESKDNGANWKEKSKSVEQYNGNMKASIQYEKQLVDGEEKWIATKAKTVDETEKVSKAQQKLTDDIKKSKQAMDEFQKSKLNGANLTSKDRNSFDNQINGAKGLKAQLDQLSISGVQDIDKVNARLKEIGNSFQQIQQKAKIKFDSSTFSGKTLNNINGIFNKNSDYLNNTDNMTTKSYVKQLTDMQTELQKIYKERGTLTEAEETYYTRGITNAKKYIESQNQIYVAEQKQLQLQEKINTATANTQMQINKANQASKDNLVSQINSTMSGKNGSNEQYSARYKSDAEALIQLINQEKTMTVELENEYKKEIGLLQQKVETEKQYQQFQEKVLQAQSQETAKQEILNKELQIFKETQLQKIDNTYGENSKNADILDENMLKNVEQLKAKISSMSIENMQDKEFVADLKMSENELNKIISSKQQMLKVDQEVIATQNKINQEMQRQEQAENTAKNKMVELEGVIKNINGQMETFNRTSAFKSVDKSAYSGVKLELQSITTELEKMRANGDTDFNELSRRAKQLGIDFKEIQVNAKNTFKDNSLEMTMSKNMTAFDAFFTDLGKIAMWGAATGALYGGLRQITDGISQIVQMNSDLAVLNITMDASQADFQKLANASQDYAIKMGTSVSNVMNSIKVFTNMNETADSLIKKIQADILLQNLSGIDPTQSTDSIQAFINQFDLLADAEGDVEKASMRVTDSLTRVSASMPMDFQRGIVELTDAIKVSGSVAKEAGFTLEQYEGILGTVIAKTRLGGSQVGNALKTVISRLGRAKTGDESAETISASDSAYKSIGVKLRDTKGEFRDIPDVLENLSMKWDKMTKVQRSYIAEVSAGIRQKSIFLNMMNSWTDAMKLNEQAVNSNGFALNRNKIYMQTIKAKLEELKSTLTSIWVSGVNSKWLSSIVEGGVGAITTIKNISNSIGLLPTLLASAGIAISLFSNKFKFFNLSFQRNSFGKIEGLNFGGVFSKALDSYRNFVTEWTKLNQKSMYQNGTFNQMPSLLTRMSNGFQALTSSTIMQTVAEGALTVASTALNMALTMGIGLVIGQVVTGLMNWFSSSEKTKQSVEDLTNSVQQNIQKNNDNISSLKDLFATYDNLRNKTTLTTEESKKYHDTMNDIAKLSPTLVAGYDSQGDAILKQNANLKDAIKLLQEKNRLEQLKLVDSGDDAFSTYKDQIKKAKQTIEDSKVGIRYAMAGINTYKNGNLSKNEIQKAVDEGSLKTLKEYEQDLANYNSKIEVQRDAIKSATDQFRPFAMAVLQTSGYYDKLSQSSKNFLTTYINNKDNFKGKDFTEIQVKINQLINSMSTKQGKDLMKSIDDLNNKAKDTNLDKYNNKLTTLSESLSKITNIKAKNIFDTFFNGNTENIVKSTDAISELTDKLTTMNEVEGNSNTTVLSTALKNTETNIKTITSALEEYDKQGSFSNQTIKELSEQFPQLNKVIKINGDTLILDKKAVEDLKNSQKSQFDEAILGQKQSLDKTIDIVTKKIASYTADLTAFSVVEQAKRKEIDKTTKAMQNADSSASMLYSKQYENQKKDFEKRLNLKTATPEDIFNHANIQQQYDEFMKNTYNPYQKIQKLNSLKKNEDSGLISKQSREQANADRNEIQDTIDILKGQLKQLQDIKQQRDIALAPNTSSNSTGTGSTTPSKDQTVSNDYASPSSKALTADIDKQITKTKNEIEKQKNRESQLYLWSKKQVDDYYNNRRKLQNDLIKENEAKKNKLIEEQNRVNNEFKNPKSALMTYFEKTIGIKDPLKSYENNSMQNTLKKKDKSDSDYMNGLQKKIDALSGKTDKNSKASIKKYKEMINARKSEATKRKKEYDKFAKDYEIKGTIGTDITAVDSDLISSKQEKANINTEQINNYIESKDKSLAPLDNKESQMKSKLEFEKAQKVTLSGLNQQISLNKQLQAVENQRANISTKYADDLRKKAIGLGATLDKNKNIVMTSVPAENRDAVQAIVNKVNELKQSWFDSKNAANGYADEIRNINEQKLKIASDVENKIEDMIKKSKDLQEKELDKDLKNFKSKQDEKIKKLDELYNKQKQIDEMNDKDKEINKINSQMDILSGDNSDWANSKRKELQDNLDKLMSEKNEKLAENSYNKQKSDLEDLTTKMENDTQVKKDTLDEKYSDENVKKIAEIAVTKGQILTEDIKYLNTETKKINEQYVDLKTAFIDYESTFGDGLTMLSDKTTDFVNNLKIAQQAIIDLDKDMKNTINSSKSKNVPNIKTQEEAEAYVKQQKQTTSTPKTNSNSKTTVKPTTPTTKTNSVGNLLKNATNIGIPKNILNSIPQGIIDNINESLNRTINSSSLVPQVTPSTIPNVSNINNSKTISVTNHIDVTIPNTGDINKNTQKAATKSFEDVFGLMKGVLGGSLGL